MKMQIFQIELFIKYIQNIKKLEKKNCMSIKISKYFFHYYSIYRTWKMMYILYDNVFHLERLSTL